MVEALKRLIKECVKEALEEMQEKPASKIDPLQDEPENVTLNSRVLAEWIYGEEDE